MLNGMTQLVNKLETIQETNLQSYMCAFSFVDMWFLCSKKQMQTRSLQKQGKDHILDVPPSTCAAVTAGICFALSVGSEEGREERDELVWSDWWVGGGEGQR